MSSVSPTAFVSFAFPSGAYLYRFVPSSPPSSNSLKNIPTWSSSLLPWLFQWIVASSVSCFNFLKKAITSHRDWVGIWKSIFKRSSTLTWKIADIFQTISTDNLFFESGFTVLETYPALTPNSSSRSEIRRPCIFSK